MDEALFNLNDDSDENFNPRIPDPPPSPQFDSFNDLLSFLQDFYRNNGAALIKRSTCPSHVILGCDRGRIRPSESSGIRQTSTSKTGCLFKVIAKTNKKLNGKWIYQVHDGSHNHTPSLHPAAHPTHRKRTLSQLQIESNLSKHKALGAREMAEIIRDTSQPDKGFFNQKDIYNDRQKLRRSALLGLSPTQRWIDILQRSNFHHSIKYNDDGVTPEAVFWTYPWCERMWKRFPEVLGMDNTYKTNRFNLCLFQVTGVTDQKSVANLAFGLINGEKEQDFQWLLQQLETFRISLDLPIPSIVITDQDNALKNALLSLWPQTQQQLCVYHINANVKAHAYAKWHRQIDNEADDNLNLFLNDIEDLVGLPNLNESIEYSPAGFFQAWKQVVFAFEEKVFEAKWKEMIDTFGQHQNHILLYITKQYMPYREQWAECFIRRYRNYGQRVNSPVETAHKDVKSYLITGTGDLLHLHEAIVQMLDRKERDYLVKAAQMLQRQRLLFLNRDWLGELGTQVSYAAIDLLADQHRRAYAALTMPLEPSVQLSRCPEECFFTQRYALPCAHYIKRSLEVGKPILKEAIHPRWWLDKPLVR
jgi:hypothetical protein